MPRETTAKAAHLWERDELDWYVEPPVATRALLTVERFDGLILDPCCGQGNIVSSCIEAGYRAVGTDIKRRTDAAWFSREMRFEDIPDRSVPNIISNPPFYRAQGTEAFIRRAACAARSKLAVFVDTRFLGGQKRAAGLWSELCPHRVWFILPRLSCPPGEFLEGGNKASNGTSDWCWLVWDLTAPPVRSASLSWLVHSKAEAGR